MFLVRLLFQSKLLNQYSHAAVSLHEITHMRGCVGMYIGLCHTHHNDLISVIRLPRWLKFLRLYIHFTGIRPIYVAYRPIEICHIIAYCHYVIRIMYRLIQYRETMEQDVSRI